MNPEKLENFERAFSDSTASCRWTCECGVTFFDGCQSYDWEDGELDKLRADPKAKQVDYAPGSISFEGRQYVDACDCWHKRALQIIRFIDGHAERIANYLRLEKERKQRDAEASPVV